jgi:hypothetical protein
MVLLPLVASRVAVVWACALPKNAKAIAETREAASGNKGAFILFFIGKEQDRDYWKIAADQPPKTISRILNSAVPL